MFILHKGKRLKSQPAAGKNGLLPVGAPWKEEGRNLSCLSIFSFLSFKNYIYVCMFEGLWVPLYVWPYAEARGQLGKSVIAFHVSFEEPPQGISLRSKCFLLLPDEPLW